MKYEVAIIGGGLIGLSTALALSRKFRGMPMALFEKESKVCAHQSGRNSGVIHSGIYYPPDSLKSRFSKEGRRLLEEFCMAHDIRFEKCGKIIVASRPDEMPALEKLYVRGKQHGLDIKMINEAQIKEIEPHSSGLNGIWVPEAGICDFIGLGETLLKLMADSQIEVHKSVQVDKIDRHLGYWRIESSGKTFETKWLINTAGLYADRIARLSGCEPSAKIVPFRGEYFELSENRSHLVKNLIYPVPDARFPFLGVHLTRGISGRIHCGPNAVLALHREGYSWSDISFEDCLEIFKYGGFWKFAARFPGIGIQEILRSLSKTLFLKSLQRLVPEITKDDIHPTKSGVRAQCISPRGELMTDFVIDQYDQIIHIISAPSPAATCSLAIGNYISSLIR